jgi:hypothetical protein
VPFWTALFEPMEEIVAGYTSLINTPSIIDDGNPFYMEIMVTFKGETTSLTDPGFMEKFSFVNFNLKLDS